MIFLLCLFLFFIFSFFSFWILSCLLPAPLENLEPAAVVVDSSSNQATKGTITEAIQSKPPFGSSPPETCESALPDVPKISLVIPFYEKDLCRTKLLSRGIQRFAQPGTFHTVHLVWVSKELPDLHQEDLDFIRRTLHDAGIVTRFHVKAVEHGSTNGWVVQQVVKLEMAKEVSTPFYLVLDSKNAPIRPFGVRDFVNGDGKGFLWAQYTLGSLQDPHKRWHNEALRTLGAENLPESSRTGQCVTPFVLHRQSTLDLLSELSRRTSRSLYDVIDAKGGTEFAFYNVYVRAGGRDVTCHHQELQSWPSYVHWTGGKIESLRQILETPVENQYFMFFGVHRGRFWQRGEVTETENLVRSIYEKNEILRSGDTWWSFENCIAPEVNYADSSAVSLAASDVPALGQKQEEGLRGNVYCSGKDCPDMNAELLKDFSVKMAAPVGKSS